MPLSPMHLLSGLSSLGRSWRKSHSCLQKRASRKKVRGKDSQSMREAYHITACKKTVWKGVLKWRDLSRGDKEENRLNKNVKIRKCKRDGSKMGEKRHENKRNNIILWKVVLDSRGGGRKGDMEKAVAGFIFILSFRKSLLHCNIMALYGISGKLRDHILPLSKIEPKLPRKEFFPFFNTVISGIYSSILNDTECSLCGRHCAGLGWAGLGNNAGRPLLACHGDSRHSVI